MDTKSRANENVRGIARPAAGEQQEISVSNERIALEFPLSEARADWDGETLVLSFDDGGSLIIEGLAEQPEQVQIALQDGTIVAGDVILMSIGENGLIETAADAAQQAPQNSGSPQDVSFGELLTGTENVVVGNEFVSGAGTGTVEVDGDPLLPPNPTPPDLTSATDSGDTFFSEIVAAGNVDVPADLLALDTDDYTNSNAPSFTGVIDPTGGFVESVTLNVANEAGDIVWTETLPIFSGPWTITVPEGTLDEGVYSVTTVANGVAGLSATSAPLIIYIDQTPPPAPAQVDASIDANGQVVSVSAQIAPDTAYADTFGDVSFVDPVTDAAVSVPANDLWLIVYDGATTQSDVEGETVTTFEHDPAKVVQVISLGADPTTLDFEAAVGTDIQDLTFAIVDRAGNLSPIAPNHIIIGTDGDDALTGQYTNTSGDFYFAAGGNDLIEGGKGADTIDGGTGSDTITYASSAAAVAVNLETGVLSGGDAEGDTISNIENVTGSDFDDTLVGDAGENVLKGGDGNDLLEGGDGADTIEGGEGIDTASYENSGRVWVDLTREVQTEGQAEGDRLTGIENLIGGAENDVLKGDDNVNRIEGGDGFNNLWGRGGDDTIIGGADIDIVNGGAGADTMDGGGGSQDRLDYQTSDAGVTINLATGEASGGHAEGDTFTNFESVSGSRFDDTLTGDAGRNYLGGGAGNDLLDGGGGADQLNGWTGVDTVTYAASSEAVDVDLTRDRQKGGDAEGDLLQQIENVVGSDHNDKLVGDAGANVLSGGDGNDLIEGGDGADTIKGGAGIDTASYANSGRVWVDLNREVQTEGQAEGDRLTGIENLIGGAENDVLKGDDNVNRIEGGNGFNNLWGRGGDDTIIGGDDIDIIEGGAGADTIDGGAGSQDRIDYQTSDAGVTINLATGEASGGHAEGDTFTNVESVYGSNHDDTLTGDAGRNFLGGGAGNDLLDGGAGADQLSGWTGVDTVTYAASSEGVSIDLNHELQTGAGGDAEGDRLQQIENVIGSDHADTLVGDAGANVLSGGDGNDLIEGGDGADTIKGGEGIDTASYENSGRVWVDLNREVQTEGQAEGDRLTGIENLIGGAENDVLKGDDNVNRIEGGNGYNNLWGRGGDDTIIGGDDIDIINGGAGADTIDGGAGSQDRLDYQTSNAGVTINLATGEASGGHAEGDTFTNIENVSGSNYDDTLTGDAGNNYLGGGAGNDLLDGGAGADQLSGWTGVDTVTYAASSEGVSVDLNRELQTGAGGDAEGDRLQQIENVIGSDHADTLVGDAGANVLSGGDGNDLIEGGDGADIIKGGEGIDTASYANSGRVWVDLNREVQTEGQAEGDRLTGIENLIGGAENDVLKGDDNVNRIEGGNGFNNLFGRGGDDTIIGGDDLDIIEGGAGADTLDGGGGTQDRLDYQSSDAGVTINLATGEASGGHAEGDTFTNFEKVSGSRFDDTLTGDAGRNYLGGRGGNDVLDGGAGADQIDGGSGVDTVTYAASSEGVSIDLNNEVQTGAGGDAEGDRLQNIENVTGSDHADTLVGDAGANVLSGGDGNDLIEGGDGADTIKGGAGVDTASYANSGRVWVDLNRAVQTEGQAEGDRLTGIENLIGGAENDVLKGDDNVNRIEGGDGSNTLWGRGGDDTLIGGVDKDIIEGGAGADTIDGGGGAYDRIDYQTSNAGVTINLATGEASGGHAEGDTFTNIEQVAGSRFDDTLTGDAGVNYLGGGDGNDLLDGGAGADQISGWTGVDTVTYAASSEGVSINLNNELQTGAGGDAEGDRLQQIENVIGSAYADTLVGDSGANALSGGEGDDVIEGGAGADILDGGEDTDTVSYATSVAGVAVSLATGAVSGGHAQGDTILNFENIVGSDHADTLTGDSGANVINGGDGNDVIEGGAGADIIIGGEGIDTASYANSGRVRVNLNKAVQERGDAEGDTLTGIENLTGSSEGDFLRGNNEVNVIRGGGGNDNIWGDGGDDRLFGEGGKDTIKGGTGADYIDGGTGIDNVDYKTSSTGVNVDLGAGTATGGDAEGDTLVNIEGLRGSRHADTLRGDAGVNVLFGNDGNDVLDGKGGADEIDGGEGVDTVEYEGSTSAVDVDLTRAVQVGGDAEGDTLTSVENIIGSEHDDTLRGDAGDNELRGKRGNDLINGGAGADDIRGGYGVDTVSYEDSGRVWVDLNREYQTEGHAEGDRLRGIENIIGSAENDVLKGDDGVNTIRGGDSGSGADIIYGRGGDDFLYGEDGYDIIEGGAGADLIDGGAGDSDKAVYETSDAAVHIDLSADTASGGHAEGDQLDNIESVTGSHFADTLTGTDARNVFSGNDGDDTINAKGGDDEVHGNGGDDFINAGAGADYIDGGADTDTLSYEGSTAGVNVNLATGEASGGDAEGDRIHNIENLTGSDHADTLTGDSGANILRGGDGNDILNGGAGEDQLFGGDGEDIFKFTSDDFSGDDKTFIKDFNNDDDSLEFDAVIQGTDLTTENLTVTAREVDGDVEVQITDGDGGNVSHDIVFEDYSAAVLNDYDSLEAFAAAVQQSIVTGG